MPSLKKAVIIGAGIGGLATAALLAKEGYSVTILEKNDSIGGRAQVLHHKGFTFDLGPSWYLMPDAFERFFAKFGKKPEELMTLIRLDPHYRIFFDKNDFIDIAKDLKKNIALFEKIEKGASVWLPKYLNIAKYQYDVAMRDFLYKNYDSVLDFLDKKMLLEGPKLHVFESFEKYVSRFTKNNKLKKILMYTIVFLGGSPKKTPALYSLMAHVDFNLGVFYPMGGINKLIESIANLGKTHGAQLVTSANVTKIIVENGVATGVKTPKKTYDADVVISNADYPFTEMQLIEKKYQTYSQKYWESRTLAPSAFLMYLGIKGEVKNLKHHTLFFSNDWEKHFDEIFEKKGWPEKPSYYICAPSKTDPSVAPKGYENIFVLIPVAVGLSDTDEVREKMAKDAISHIEYLTGESIADRIVFKKIHTHRDYKELYNAYQGTALGLAHTLFQTAVFRPKNKSKKVSNLYYVGQYTNPGIGMPICLISAELTAERIKNEVPLLK